MADGLATALFMQEPAPLEKEFEFSWLTVSSSGAAAFSKGFEGETVHMIAAKSRVDTWLGRFTMYRLILWVLGVLAAYSMVLNILGWLTFGLPEMLVHLVLCLGATYASGRLLALLFGVKQHTESSLITGLLLYFLFWPAFGAMDMAGVALACVLASVSKYALAFRGRHIFNPAAAGAFITGLTGLNIATWWAATPGHALAPGSRSGDCPVSHTENADGHRFPGGCHKHHHRGAAEPRYDAGTGFMAGLGPTAVAVFRRLHAFGTSHPASPPLAAVGACRVVGVVFAVPYNFGFIANSPELALLLGNLIAFFLGQRGGVHLTFKGSRPLTPPPVLNSGSNRSGLCVLSPDSSWSSTCRIPDPTARAVAASSALPAHLARLRLPSAWVRPSRCLQRRRHCLLFDPGTAFPQQPWVETLFYRTTPGSRSC